MAAPGSLEVFKGRLDRAWGNLVWWNVFLPMAGVRMRCFFRSLSVQAWNPFCDYRTISCYKLNGVQWMVLLRMKAPWLMKTCIAKM